MSVNKVILIGRVGRQPEVTTLNNGTRMAKFSLATNENYTDKQGQKVEQTEWHNCTIWGPQAEIVEKWITSGMLLYVEGKLKTSCYEKAGAKHYSTDVIVSGFRMLGGKPQQEAAPTNHSMKRIEDVQDASHTNMEMPDDGEQLPF